MSTLLMLADTPVYELDGNKCQYDVIRPDLLPWSLRGYVRKDGTIYERINENNTSFTRWLSNRTLALSRKHAKDIYNLLGVDPIDTDINKAKLALMFHATSLIDNYWVKDSKDSVIWSDVNLRHNKMNTVVTQVALCGSSLSLQGPLMSPEFSTQGSFAKAWIREEDGLYLHKRSSDSGLESEIEVMCSKLLDKTNVRHVKYEYSELYGYPTCKCKLMSDDIVSIMPAVDMIYYTKVNGLNYFEHVLTLDHDSMCKMFVVDYLFANKDRHSLNWGYEYNAATTGILNCHPLYDHNLAFDKEYMKNPDAIYKFNNKASMRKSAQKAIGQVDFIFTEEIVRGDFMTTEQYDCFMYRADELKIETRKS